MDVMVRFQRHVLILLGWFGTLGCLNPIVPEDVVDDSRDTRVTFPRDTRAPGDTWRSLDSPSDTKPSSNAIPVRFDDGILYIETDPLHWRVDASDPGVSNRVQVAQGVPFLSIETMPEAEQVFHDPRPALDVAPPHWKVVDFVQERYQGEISMTLEDTNDPQAGQLTLAITPDAGGLRFDIDYTPTDQAIRRVEIAWQDDGGPLFGGGERFGSLNARGQLVPLFLAEDPFTPGGTNRAHLPVPFVLNPTGYGIYFESQRAGALELGREGTPNVLRARFDDPTAIRMYLWLNREGIEILDEFTALTGRPAAPPTWTLAPHFWRPGPRDAASLLADAESLRRLQIASGALWLDRPWSSAYNDFTFNPSRFPEPQSFVTALREKGFDLVLWTTPYLNTSDDSDIGLDGTLSQALFDAAAQEGLLVTDPGSTPLEIPWDYQRTGGLVDFTNPEAVAWWKALVGDVLDLGIRGFKLDGVESIWAFPQGRNPVSFLFSDGSTELTMHRLYNNLYHTVFAELFEERGIDGFLCARAGTTGVQTAAQCIWPPALSAEFSPGGLSDAVTAALSLSTSGVPFFGSEIGGSSETPVSQELMLRWLGFGVFNTTLQIGLDPAPWEAPYDERALDIVRKLTTLRIQLSPYLELEYARAAREGTPVLRPLALMHPRDAQTWEVEDAFYVGPDLLVAPVLVDGARSRTVYLPQGNWRSWETGGLLEGERIILAQAPLDRVPIFVRDGAVIPMRLDIIDTLGPASAPGVQSAQDLDETYHIRIFGRADGETTLPGDVPFVVDYNTQSDFTRLIFTASNEGVQHVYVEFVGLIPRVVTCGGENIPFDDTLAIGPMPDDAKPAIRLLPVGTLLQLPTSIDCQVVWY